MNRITIVAITSALGGFVLGACIFKKVEGGPSPAQLLQLLAQATSCWISSGNSVTTSCSVGIAGATPDANTKLAVNGRISSSVLGVYCGKTGTTYNGAQVGGYTGAKAKCQAACGSTNAHMCSAHELSTSLQLDVAIGSGGLWYTSGMVADIQGGSTSMGDCAGWTVSGAGSYGSAIGSGPGTFPAHSTCDVSRSIACCL